MFSIEARQSHNTNVGHHLDAFFVFDSLTERIIVSNRRGVPRPLLILDHSADQKPLVLVFVDDGDSALECGHDLESPC